MNRPAVSSCAPSAPALSISRFARRFAAPVLACGSLLLSAARASAEFVFAAPANAAEILSARFVGNFAGLTAHRRFGTVEVNRVRLLDPDRTLPELNLSTAFFGDVAYYGATRIQQTNTQTGLFDAAIPASFYPVILKGRIDLVALFTDTEDSAFAIDTLFVEINLTNNRQVRAFYGSGLDGFLLNPPVAQGANLAGDVRDILPAGRTGTGFDETVSSKAIDTPGPGTFALALPAAWILGRRRQRSRLASATPSQSHIRLTAAILPALLALALLSPASSPALASMGNPTEPGPDADYPSIGLFPNQYAEGELLWTFLASDPGTLSNIRQYLTTPPPSGAGAQIYSSWTFLETNTTVFWTSTLPCRTVAQSVQLITNGGLNPQDDCPGIVSPAVAGFPIEPDGLEPNMLNELRQAAVPESRRRAPNDPGFRSQWNMDNTGQLIGFMWAESTVSPPVGPPAPVSFDSADSIYIDVNLNGVVDASDQLILGPGVAVNTAMNLFDASVGFIRAPETLSRALRMVVYQETVAPINRIVVAGDRRVFGCAACGLPTGLIGAADRDRGFRVRPMATPGTIDADVDAVQSWAGNVPVALPNAPVQASDCGETIVGVIDTGIDVPNPDLTPNLWTNPAPTFGDNRGAAWVAAEAHDETINANGDYDIGEAIYFDTDGSQTVTAGDRRLTPIGALAVGPVAAGDADVVVPPRPLRSFPRFQTIERYVDLNANGQPNANEPIYLDTDGSGFTGPAALLRRPPLQNGGVALAAFPAATKHGDFVPANGSYDRGEPLYRDADGDNAVSNGDVRLTPVARAAGGAYAEGSVVSNVPPGAVDEDVGIALTSFRTTGGFVQRHAENIAANNDFDNGEWIVNDRDYDRRISVGDRRVTATQVGAVVFAAGTLVAAGNADIGTALIDFRTNVPSGNIQDLAGHGTGVSSVIGARGDNNIGIAGVCWRTRIMMLRAMDAGVGNAIDKFVAAVDYAVAQNRAGQPVRVLNFSAGSSRVGSRAERAAIEAANTRGILFAVAADNQDCRDVSIGADVVDCDNPRLPPPVAFDFPTCYSGDPRTPNVISVGSSSNRDTRRFARSRTFVTLAAPGEQVPVLTLGGGGRFEFVNGCSFASPHVAGALLQAIRLFPDLANAPGGHLTMKAFLLDNNFLDSRRGLDNSYIAGLNNSARLRLLSGFDFGDAPAPFPTLARDPAVMAARHRDINEEWLGRATPLPVAWFQPPINVNQPRASDVSPEWDAENRAAPIGGAPTIPPDPDGQPNLTDSDRADDGVQFLTPLMWSPDAGPANTAVVRLFVDTQNAINLGARNTDANDGRYPQPDGTVNNPTPGVAAPADDKFLWLNLWIDFNRNGTWDDAGERVLALRINPGAWISPGANPLPQRGAVYTIKFPMPKRPANVQLGTSWARTRLDYGENAGTPLIATANLRPTTDPAVGFVDTAPGGMVRLYSDAGGLDNAGPYTKNRYESPLNAATGGVLRVRNFAQFGEVEDTRVELFPSNYVIVPDQLHLSGPQYIGTSQFVTLNATLERVFVGVPNQDIRFRALNQRVQFVPEGLFDVVRTTDEYGYAGVRLFGSAVGGEEVIEATSGPLTAYHIIRYNSASPPPCRPDFNGDGRLEPTDLFAFLNAYFTGDPRADTDASGRLEATDIFQFLTLYFAGCPAPARR